MKDHETWPLAEITAAAGCFLELKDGRKILDAISSWWCKSLGHQHPRIKRAVQQQLERFEHVMLAGTTYDVVVNLSEQLAQLMPSLNKVLFAGDGSSAIEMALKLSLHTHRLMGAGHRTKFIALNNAYHGETAGAMSVSDLGLYRDAYEPMLFSTQYVKPPYVTGESDAGWHDCETHWDRVLLELEANADITAAVIVEPVVQGAGGMLIYSEDFLRRLRAWTSQHGIHLIADEIMTGIGRTGKMLACEHAEVVPDFLCLSKGLTSGWLPLSVTLTNQSIYDLFYQDYALGNSFLHSHTYSGNALAASAALETLLIMKEECMVDRSAALGADMRVALQRVADETSLLKNVRGLGAMVAADLVVSSERQRAGLDVYHAAMQHGTFLRPLGNTIYWLPPLIMNQDELALLEQSTRDAIVVGLNK
jgi:adenosylmethionine-8-amino-7-oxononanoate aminotransferase